MFLKLLKIKFTETFSKPPVIISLVVAIILNITTFVLVWQMSDLSFYHNNFIYVMISLAVDFIIIFLLSYFLFLEDMLNYNDINYVSKSINKGVIAWVKLIIIWLSILAKAIIDSILVVIVMVSVRAVQFEIGSEVLVTLIGQFVFGMSITPLFLLISLSKKFLSYIGITFAVFAGIFGLGTLSRTVMIDKSANNTITYDRKNNKFNYASIYDKQTGKTRIATEENDPNDYKYNLNGKWNTAISNLSPINDFMPSNLFFSFSEVLYNSTSEYYKDISYATKFTGNNYGWSNSRFVFTDYELMKNINRDDVYFFNPEHPNIFAMNPIELSDYIIESMEKIKGINWEDTSPSGILGRLYSTIRSAANNLNPKWDFQGTETERDTQVRVLMSFLGLNDVAPGMYYLIMYDDPSTGLLKTIPNILTKIKSKYNETAAGLFAGLFLSDLDTYVKDPDGIKYDRLKYSTIYNINLGSGLNPENQIMTPYYEYTVNSIPFPFISNEFTAPLRSTIDFMKNTFIRVRDGGASQILLKTRLNGALYLDLDDKYWKKLDYFGGSRPHDQEAWNKKVDEFSSSNGSLRELYKDMKRAIVVDNQNIIYDNPRLWDNYFNPNTFAYTNNFTSVPYTGSAAVFSTLNILLIPVITYVAIFCYKKTSLDTKSSNN